MKRGKKYQEAIKKYDKAKVYSISEAAGLVKELSFAKFDETVELHIKLMLKKSQSVRDTVVLPNQFSAEKKILVSIHPCTYGGLLEGSIENHIILL